MYIILGIIRINDYLEILIYKIDVLFQVFDYDTNNWFNWEDLFAWREISIDCLTFIWIFCRKHDVFAWPDGRGTDNNPNFS